MPQRPQLVLSSWIKGDPVHYRCSGCNQRFILPEDRTPKEAMIEVLAAFALHISEEHPDGHRGPPEGTGIHEHEAHS